jgi:hypothetical protein
VEVAVAPAVAAAPAVAVLAAAALAAAALAAAVLAAAVLVVAPAVAALAAAPAVVALAAAPAVVALAVVEPVVAELVLAEPDQVAVVQALAVVEPVVAPGPAAGLVLAAVAPVRARAVAELAVPQEVAQAEVPVPRAQLVQLAVAVRPWVVAAAAVSARLERLARARPEVQSGRSRPHPISQAQLEPVLLQDPAPAMQLRTEQVLMAMARRATADGRTGTTTELAPLWRRPAPTDCAQCISGLTYSRASRTV